MKVAIIGAGATGLAAAKICIAEKYDIEVFEQTGQIGGTWIYSDFIEEDEEGIPVHTSMYQDLRTNVPKELMEFENFPFPADIKPSIITQKEVLDYIIDFANQFDLKRHIKFYTQIVNVDPLPEGRKWKVKALNLKTKEETEGIYDLIMVCNGHYKTFIIPDIPGKDTFSGYAIHSHHYRSTKPFENKTVVVIGAGPSGTDISRLVASVAKKVYLSNGTANSNMPANIIVKPKVCGIKEYSVIFTNGEEVQVDSIIYCTGFSYSFKFLSKNCGIEVDDNWVKPLYKQIININNPTMALIGIPVKVCPFPVSELQVRFFLSYIKGNFTVTKEEMLKDLEEEIAELQRREVRKCYYHLIGDYQLEYCEKLAEIGKIRRIKPAIGKLYLYYRNSPVKDRCYRYINDEEYIEY